MHLLLTGRHPFEPALKLMDYHRASIIRKNIENGQLMLGDLADGPADLLRKMLHPKPDRRISFSDILQHRWLFVGSFARRSAIMDTEPPTKGLMRSNTMGNLGESSTHKNVPTIENLEETHSQAAAEDSGELSDRGAKKSKAKPGSSAAAGQPEAARSPRGEDNATREDDSDHSVELRSEMSSVFDPFNRQTEYLGVNLDSSMIENQSGKNASLTKSIDIRHRSLVLPPTTSASLKADTAALLKVPPVTKVKIASEELAQASALDAEAPSKDNKAPPDNPIIKRFEATLAKIDTEILSLKQPKNTPHTDRLRELAIENEQLKLEIARIRKPDESLGPLLSRLESLEKENRRLQTANNELEHEVSERRAELGLSEEQLILVKLERDIIDSQRYDKLLNQEIDGLVSFLKTPTYEEGALVGALQRSAEANARTLQPLCASTKSLETRLAPEVVAMNSQIDEFEEKFVQKVNTDIATATQRLVEMDVVVGEKRRLEQQVRDLDTKLLDTNRRLQEQTSANVTLSEQLRTREDDLQSASEAILSLKRKVDLLKGELLTRKTTKSSSSRSIF